MGKSIRVGKRIDEWEGDGWREEGKKGKRERELQQRAPATQRTNVVIPECSHWAMAMCDCSILLRNHHPGRVWTGLAEAVLLWWMVIGKRSVLQMGVCVVHTLVPLFFFFFFALRMLSSFFPSRLPPLTYRLASGREGGGRMGHASHPLPASHGVGE